MNKFNCNKLKALLLIFGLAIMLSGCEPGNIPSLPTRKKMPQLTLDDETFEGKPAFERDPVEQTIGDHAFNAQNIDLNIGGITQSFVSFSLPDASADSATVSLLQSLKPFALPLLANWAKQQRHGVAIDLSAHNGEAIHRGDFILEQPNGFSFPLVIMWDKNSEYRLNTIKQLIAEMPSLRLNTISNN